MKAALAAAVLALAGTPSFAHRLDEYLQGTILSVQKDRIEAEMTLTPGVAVFPMLIPHIDTDSNGVISESEQRAYAGRVLQDLSVTIDGHRLTPHLSSVRFPGVDEMKEGSGGIRLDFSAELPPGGRDRKLTIENRHESLISVYQVNCLVPVDPDIRIAAQNRNYSQSAYEVEYSDSSVSLLSVWWAGGGRAPVIVVVILLFARLMSLWWRKRLRDQQPAELS